MTKKILLDEKIDRTSRILDVGCGTGQTAASLAATYGAKVIGLDINPIMVEKTRKRMEKSRLPVEIIQGSIEECPLKDGLFDYIISESVLAFVNAPKAIKEIYRLLKKEGRFICNELTINHPLQEINKQEIKKFYGVDAVRLENEWIALFEQAGFKKIAVQMHNYPILGNNNNVKFEYSDYIEPELFTVMYEHINIMLKYQGTLDYRIISCIK